MVDDGKWNCIVSDRSKEDNIQSAKVMGKDRLEVNWKYGDDYEKILGKIQ